MASQSLPPTLGSVFGLSGEVGRPVHNSTAFVIEENLGESVIGLDDKLAAGLTYALTVDNPSLAEKLRSLGARELPDSPTQTLARAISPSSAAVAQKCSSPLGPSHQRGSSNW